MNTRSFSLVEVMVASVIFAMAATGIFATINLTNQSSGSDSRVKAALFGKKILDGLSREVSPDGWAEDGKLSLGEHQVSEDPDFSGYAARYTVFSDTTGARKVTVNVFWTPSS